MTRIRKFATFWNISADVENAIKAIENKQKKVAVSDLTDGDFALVVTHGGEKIRKYAAVDSETTIAAAESLYNNRKAYPYEWRKEAAVRLLAKADKYDAVLPDFVNHYLHKAAGFGAVARDVLDNLLAQRESLVPKVHEDTLRKVAFGLEDLNAEELTDNATMIMGALDEFDRISKLSQYYGDKVDMPEAIVAYTEPELSKHAGISKNIVKLSNGLEIDVRGISPAHLDAAGLSKLNHAQLIDVLPTLPRPDADLLCRIIP